ncbi:hypothetical protein C6T69_15985, partial [Burkholderia multivorans]|uniref:phytanoyl-CoA dioxygenase family protein n=1 Tax=Burkholderia multivorans TaxID=87883 RepID=UPI000D486267
MSGKAGSGEVEPQRLVSDDELERYRVDGAVALRGHFAPWVERLRAATERVLEHPGPLGTRYGKDSHRGTFRGDRYMWTFDPDFRDFALSGPGARLAGELMDASSTRLFYDHLLVKEPGAEAPTPWHQDLPYWCVDGEQICWQCQLEGGAVEWRDEKEYLAVSRFPF